MTITLFHYTDEQGKTGILEDGYIEPSSGGHDGEGVYLTQLSPQQHSKKRLAKNNYRAGANPALKNGKVDYAFKMALPFEEVEKCTSYDFRGRNAWVYSGNLSLNMYGVCLYEVLEGRQTRRIELPKPRKCPSPVAPPTSLSLPESGNSVKQTEHVASPQMQGDQNCDSFASVGPADCLPTRNVQGTDLSAPVDLSVGSVQGFVFSTPVDQNDGPTTQNVKSNDSPEPDIQSIANSPITPNTQSNESPTPVDQSVGLQEPKIQNNNSSEPGDQSNGPITPNVKINESSTPVDQSGGLQEPKIQSDDSSESGDQSNGTITPNVKSHDSSEQGDQSNGSITPKVKSNDSSEPSDQSNGPITPNVKSSDSSEPGDQSDIQGGDSPASVDPREDPTKVKPTETDSVQNLNIVSPDPHNDIDGASRKRRHCTDMHTESAEYGPLTKMYK